VRVCACKCGRVCARAHACERVLGYAFVRVCVQVRHELCVCEYICVRAVFALRIFLIASTCCVCVYLCNEIRKGQRER